MALMPTMQQHHAHSLPGIVQMLIKVAGLKYADSTPPLTTVSACLDYSVGVRRGVGVRGRRALPENT